MSRQPAEKITGDEFEMLIHLEDQIEELDFDECLTLRKIYGSEKWDNEVSSPAVFGALVAHLSAIGELRIRQELHKSDRNHVLYRRIQSQRLI